MTGPLRPNPPPPSNLMAVGKKGFKKIIFSLMAWPFTSPTPLLMAQPLREELFFAASLSAYRSVKPRLLLRFCKVVGVLSKPSWLRMLRFLWFRHDFVHIFRYFSKISRFFFLGWPVLYPPPAPGPWVWWPQKKQKKHGEWHIKWKVMTQVFDLSMH